jgi:3-oxoacyl-[acyl-carrier protein] reductase
MKLAGKAAVVTGSSRGVGRNVAIAFAKEGADVLVNYTSGEGPAQDGQAIRL